MVKLSLAPFDVAVPHEVVILTKLVMLNVELPSTRILLGKVKLAEPFVKETFVAI